MHIVQIATVRYMQVPVLGETSAQKSVLANELNYRIILQKGGGGMRFAYNDYGLGALEPNHALITNIICNRCRANILFLPRHSLTSGAMVDSKPDRPLLSVSPLVNGKTELQVLPGVFPGETSLALVI